jgi:VWFA-related protein
MIMRVPLFLAWCLALAATAAAVADEQRADARTGDLVELDVVVVDRDDSPVTGLEARDFQVKEDGRPVEVKTFREINGATRRDEEERGRQLVLLLDDSSVPMNGTAVVQAMAQVVLSKMAPIDDVTVVRLNNDRDEPYGDLETALTRINAYHAGVVPYQGLGTAERTLKVIANISKQLEIVEHKRKLIVCVGGPNVCNVIEPVNRGFSNIWPAWVQAMRAAARANVAVYAIMPVPTGTRVLLSLGMVGLTGGNGFYNTGKFDRFVDDLWREATAYYLLGYWPADPKRELHSIDVKVARKGLKVRARRTRG